MAGYQVFNEKNVIEYVVKLGIFNEVTSSLTCTLIKDTDSSFRISDESNTFRINDHNKSVLFTQALFAQSHLPINAEVKANTKAKVKDKKAYLKQTDIETERLSYLKALCPDSNFDILHHNPTLACLVLEDNKDFKPLSQVILSLPNDPLYTKMGKASAHYLARTQFYSSGFYLSAQEKHSKFIQFCSLNNKATFPLLENSFIDYTCHQLADDATSEEFKNDEILIAEVAELKTKLESTSQALIHGKLEADKILINEHQVKIIAPDTGYYGPIGYDLGTLLSHYLFNFCSSALTLETYQRAEQLDEVIKNIREVWNGFADEFSLLMRDKTQDQELQNETYQARYLRSIFLDSIGFAGCALLDKCAKAISADNEMSLNDDSMVSKAIRYNLQLGIILIKKRYQFVSINDVLLEAEAIIEKE